MHRTQSAKQKRKNQKRREISLLFSRSLRGLKCGYDCESSKLRNDFNGRSRMVSSGSAEQPQHQRQQQSAEKQADNGDNYNLDRIHGDALMQTAVSCA